MVTMAYASGSNNSGNDSGNDIDNKGKIIMVTIGQFSNDCRK